jgi:hypothetical protein
MRDRPDWSEAGPEPELSDVLADPIVHLVMRRDRLTSEDVWFAVRVAQDRLRMAGSGTGVNRRTAA